MRTTIIGVPFREWKRNFVDGDSATEKRAGSARWLNLSSILGKWLLFIDQNEEAGPYTPKLHQ